MLMEQNHRHSGKDELYADKTVYCTPNKITNHLNFTFILHDVHSTFTEETKSK